MYSITYKGITFKTLYTQSQINNLTLILSHIQVKKVKV